MNFDLSRMRRVMDQLGNPQNNFPSVHVAGTNGKGSVTALMASVLKEAGLKVGMYTSPHLVQMNERFQINGRMISTSKLNSLVRLLFKKFPHLTQFELLTVIAFVWFAQQKVDVAVFETGLGGRLDATNILSNVLVSVITNIDFDHMDWLGNTIEKIAYEKAGIVKAGVPVVTGASGAALGIVKSVAVRCSSELLVVSSNCDLPTGLQGPHQKNNAAVAETALRVLDKTFFRITDEQIENGFKSVRWPGRFERILVGSGSRGRELFLDGAHNPAGCRALVKTLREKRFFPVTLLFGALKDKSVLEMAQILSPVVEAGFVVRVPSERSADPQAVADLLPWRGKMQAVQDVSQGVKKLMETRKKNYLLVAGSLYLVGDVLRRVS